jgi:thiamine monophosphate kinase
MASNLFISNALANKQAVASNVDTTGMGAMVVTVYSNSTTQPANANTALNGAAAELFHFHTPIASGNSVSAAGVITFGAISQVTPGANGTASYFRAVASDGTTVMFDGNVGTSASDLILASTTISTAIPVSITSFTYTITQ